MLFKRWNKTWIVITLLALLIYDLRWFYGVTVTVFYVTVGGMVVQTWWRFWLDYVLTGLIGDPLRLVEVGLGLFSLYLMWGPQRKPFFGTKRFVSLAVLCEAIYFLTLLPLVLIEIGQYASYASLIVGYLLQILLVAPPLVLLSVKIWRYDKSTHANVVKWAAVAGTFYIMGIWVNNLFRWIGTTDPGSLLTGTTAFGFLDTVVTLTLAVCLVAGGALNLFRKGNPKLSQNLLAASLIMVGLAFALFIRYSWITNTLSYAVLVEIWPVTLLGVGLSLLKTEDKLNSQTGKLMEEKERE